MTKSAKKGLATRVGGKPTRVRFGGDGTSLLVAKKFHELLTDPHNHVVDEVGATYWTGIQRAAFEIGQICADNMANFDVGDFYVACGLDRQGNEKPRPSWSSTRTP
jgi:hypothetical protein